MAAQISFRKFQSCISQLFEVILALRLLVSEAIVYVSLDVVVSAERL